MFDVKEADGKIYFKCPYCNKQYSLYKDKSMMKYKHCVECNFGIWREIMFKDIEGITWVEDNKR